MAFYVMEVGLPGKPKCPDQFEDVGPATLICPKSKVLLVQVSLKAVYFEFGVMEAGDGSFVGSVIWQRERSWLPVSFSHSRSFDAVRVRNFAPGEEAQVTLEAI